MLDFVLIVTLYIFYMTLISQNDKFYFLIKLPRFIYNRQFIKKIVYTEHKIQTSEL